MTQNTPSPSEIYIVDTNVLLDFRFWLPMEYHPTFWQKLEVALKDKKWILLDEVVDEIGFPEDIKKWCRRMKTSNLTTQLTSEEYARAIEINTLYPMIDQSTFKSAVDTYIIAAAESRKHMVFSREGAKKLHEVLYKIPDVCGFLKVRSIKRPAVFLKNIGCTPC
jgi:hypothetical protein